MVAALIAENAIKGESWKDITKIQKKQKKEINNGIKTTQKKSKSKERITDPEEEKGQKNDMQKTQNSASVLSMAQELIAQIQKTKKR